MIEQAVQRLQAAAAVVTPTEPCVIQAPDHADELEQLQRNLSSAQEKIVELETKCTTLQTDFHNISAAYQDRSQECTRLAQQLKDEALLKHDMEVELTMLLQHQQEQKQAQADMLASTRREYELRISELEAEQVTMQQQMVTINEQNTSLQRKVNESLSLVQDHANLKRVIMDLKAGMAMKRTESSTSELVAGDGADMISMLMEKGLTAIQKSYLGKISASG